MKFKYSVIGDNTQDNREWLEKLGYIPLKFFLNGKYIITKFCNRATAKSEWIEHYFESINNTRDAYTSINCINNPQLFQAVTAIREDSDKGKHFTDDKDWYKCLSEDSYPFLERMKRHGFREATLSELIAHFKVEH